MILPFGLAFAVAATAPACYPNPNDLRGAGVGGQVGSGGLPGTGGQVGGTGGRTGSGGVTGSGGRVGTGGTVAGTGGAVAGTGGTVAGTGGFVGAGTALLPDAVGWIARGTNGFGIQGSWYVYADGRGDDGTAATSNCVMAGHPASACSIITSPPPGNFPNTGGKMCFVGKVAQVTNIPGTTTPDYSNIWGATMAFDLNYDAMQVPPRSVVNFPARGLKGISFDLDATPLTGLRVGFATPATRNLGPAYWGATAAYPPSPVKVGNNVVYLTAVSHPMALAFDTTMIETVEFNVPTTSASDAPFNFCISNVHVLTQ